KTLDAMNKFISAFPPDAKGAMIQSALGYIVVLSSRKKDMPAAEAAFIRWTEGDPLLKNQQPALQDHLATGYYKAGEHEQSIRHAQAAFDLLKTLTAKTFQERRDREQIYMNLTEVLALGYRKTKNTDQAISILAEARAQSFALPSATLYRKVMTFVEGSGFSEKKLMQKVESYATADPAPDMKITEWMGHDPVSLEDLRGKVVLLDFWATWCGPCIVTFPRLRGWHKKFGDQNFMIVGVTQFEGNKGGKRMTQLQELEYLAEFKKDHKLPYPFAVAGPGEAATKYGVAVFPTTVLLDRNGVVRYIGIGSGSEESENLEEMIKKVIKENPRIAQK
ncbi:MAG TPA: TlpA disulfide reductase family protein, partial [Pyrinomonadaceae bacterium]|nr:TlpA disulfide reductase family protein [Pyrinomonadaceae bacterium]